MIATAIVGVLVFASAMVTLSTVLESYATSVKSQSMTESIAQQMAQFNAAAMNYFANTASAAPGDTVSSQGLINAKYLPSTFNGTNPLGQTLLAMYGDPGVITYYNNALSQSGAAQMGYTHASTLSGKSVESAIAVDAQRYTTGEGNITSGWVQNGMITAQLPMGGGSIDIHKSVPGWSARPYVTAVMMDNFKGLNYGASLTDANTTGSRLAQTYYTPVLPCPASGGNTATINKTYTSVGATQYAKVPDCARGVTIVATVEGGGSPVHSAYGGPQVGDAVAEFTVPANAVVTMVNALGYGSGAVAPPVPALAAVVARKEPIS